MLTTNSGGGNSAETTLVHRSVTDGRINRDKPDINSHPVWPGVRIRFAVRYSVVENDTRSTSFSRSNGTVSPYAYAKLQPGPIGSGPTGPWLKLMDSPCQPIHFLEHNVLNLILKKVGAKAKTNVPIFRIYYYYASIIDNIL